MAGFAVAYERCCRAILVVLVVNVAIVIHTICGLVLLGWFPSMTAACSVYRSWILSEDRGWGVAQTWTMFHRTWRCDIVKANQLGWCQGLAGALLAYAQWLTWHNDMGVYGYACGGVLLLASLWYGVWCLESWVIRAHFEATNRWVAVMAWRMVMARPLCTVGVLGVLLFTVCVWCTWPGIFMAFGVSLPLALTVVLVSVCGRLPGLRRDDTQTARLARV